MTPPPPFQDAPDSARADEQALAWVVRLTSGDVTAEDRDAFRLWRDASPAHAEALARARRLWLQMEIAAPEIAATQADAAENDRAEADRAEQIRHDRQRARFARPARGLLALAASLLLTVGLGYQYLQVWQFDQVTATGERRVVTLGDGTEVTIAAGTAIREDFTGTARRLRIARGEAFFRISRDPRPFVVEARGTEIRDVGTAFDVALRPDTTRIAVRDGMVEAWDGHSRVRIGAGQAGVVAAGGIAAPEPADIGRETAWMRGRFIATDRPLGEIVAAIAPYSHRRILVLNRAAGARRMSVAIDLNRTQEWLESLGGVRDVRVTTLPGIVIIR